MKGQSKDMLTMSIISQLKVCQPCQLYLNNNNKKDMQSKNAGEYLLKQWL